MPLLLFRENVDFLCAVEIVARPEESGYRYAATSADSATLFAFHRLKFACSLPNDYPNYTATSFYQLATDKRGSNLQTEVCSLSHRVDGCGIRLSVVAAKPLPSDVDYP